MEDGDTTSKELQHLSLINLSERAGLIMNRHRSEKMTKKKQQQQLASISENQDVVTSKSESKSNNGDDDGMNAAERHDDDDDDDDDSKKNKESDQGENENGLHIEEDRSSSLSSSLLWSGTGTGWELSWPIWHMLPRQERKDIALQHGYNTIGEFEEYMYVEIVLCMLKLCVFVFKYTKTNFFTSFLCV